ncbi:MAG: hypothetical protein K2I06_02870 [Ruminococcus sp.]|nr:hypothetical protein [Ruminococcus sp.]
MTRGEFLGEIFVKVFGVKYIEYRAVEGNIVVFETGGSKMKDCTYSINYKEEIREIFRLLFDGDYEQVKIKKKDSYDIKIYQEKAKEYIFTLIPYTGHYIKRWKSVKDMIPVWMVNRFYQEIIIEEVFNLGKLKESKERRNDNFDDAVAKIRSSLIDAINKEAVFFQVQCYQKEFLKKLVEHYPLFSELSIDEDDEMVEKHIEEIEEDVINIAETIKLSKENSLHLTESVPNEFESEKENGLLVAFSDLTDEPEEIFWLMQLRLSKLLELLVSGKLSGIRTLGNTAVRIYNHFFGKVSDDRMSRPNYIGQTEAIRQETHKLFIKYLFWLDLSLKSIDAYEEK